MTTSLEAVSGETIEAIAAMQAKYSPGEGLGPPLSLEMAGEFYWGLTAAWPEMAGALKRYILTEKP